MHIGQGTILGPAAIVEFGVADQEFSAVVRLFVQGTVYGAWFNLPAGPVDPTCDQEYLEEQARQISSVVGRCPWSREYISRAPLVHNIRDMVLAAARDLPSRNADEETRGGVAGGARDELAGGLLWH